MEIKKKVEILNGQIEKLSIHPFEFRGWLLETSNLLNLVFENASERKKQLQALAMLPHYSLMGVDEKRLSEDWRKLMESFKYELELLAEEEPIIFLDKDNFVHLERIEELKKLSSSKFDFSKLIAFCEELNSNYSNGNYLSVSMLGRAIIDHVPPLFNFQSFNEVANNYGSASFKKNMEHLNKSMRSIADSYLHQTIRKNEALPNKIQVDFRSGLDFLLGEIVRNESLR